MKSLRKIAIAFASALIILQAFVISVQALSADEIKSYIDSGLEYKYSSVNTHNADEFVAEVLAPKAGVSDSDWYIITMGRYGLSFNKSVYINALNKKLDDIYSNGISSVRITDLQRMALAYSACGADIRSASGHNLLEDCTYMRSADEMVQQGVLTLDYGLIVLDSDNYNIPNNAVSSREDIISSILSLQLANGCFSADGKTPDADATAMTVTALAPYYKNNKAVKNSVDNALEQLSKMQKSDGTFACWGKSNCESTAQVIMCLSALGIDCAKDERFIKNSDLLEALLSFRKSSGGFSHLYNGRENSMATYQALYTLVGYRSFLLENQSLYNFSREQDADKTLSGDVYATDDKYNDDNPVGDEPYREVAENSSLEVQEESHLVQISETDGDEPSVSHNETNSEASDETADTNGRNNPDIDYIVRYKQGGETPTAVGELSFYQLLHTLGVTLFLITVYAVLILHKTQKQNCGGNDNKPKDKQKTKDKSSTITDVSQPKSREKELPKEKSENQDSLIQNGEIKSFTKKHTSKFTVPNLSAKKLFRAILSVCIIVFLCSCSIKTPEEYYSGNSEATNETVHVKIDCIAALDRLPDDLKDYLPTDGIIADEAVSYSDGDTAFSVLTKVTRSNKIQLDYTGESSVYVRGISNLYEFSCGSLSGWMVNINGNYIQTSASDAEVKPGDTVAWRYTCDLGADIGNAYKGE